MKRILLLSFIIVCFSQCEKDDIDNNEPPDPEDMFELTVNPDWLVDTLTIGYGASTISEGYIFDYDQLNRVSNVEFYEYAFNMPVNNQKSFKFFYSGNNLLPERLDASWVYFYSYPGNDYRIYFYYNSDGSKNRDSIVDLNQTSPTAIRRYTYDSLFTWAKTAYYVVGDTVPKLRDSVAIESYNTQTLRSSRIKIVLGEEREDNFHAENNTFLYNRENPFIRLNIFPAMFLSNYLFGANITDGYSTASNLLMDFHYRNIMKRSEKIDEDISFERYSSTLKDAAYDIKNRVTTKYFADTTRTSTDMRTAWYHYKN